MNQSQLKAWHATDPGRAMAELGTSRSRGLDGLEAKSRLDTYGPNELSQAARKTLLQQFAAQFREFLVLLLLASAAVSVIVGEVEDAAVIGVIVLLNAVIGVMQERRAEDALEALKKMAAPRARVLRDGSAVMVDAVKLVPGDILLIEAGDSIAADARLVESALLRVDESSLTGESVPAEKNSERLLAEDASLGDRVNSVYMGSTVAYGRGSAVVTATGMRTEMGKIAKMLEQSDEQATPLQAKLEVLGKRLGMAALVMCLGVFVMGLLRGEPVFDMFLTAVSLAVAAIPEGLPAIVTIVLAVGVQRMAARNAIIRHLPAVETLGSANVICSDKTGTLTTNQMTVRRLFVPGATVHVSGEGYSFQGTFTVDGEEFDVSGDTGITRLLTCAIMCCDARVRATDGGSGRLEMIGDPTEGSIVVAGGKAGLQAAKLEQWAPRVSELPFESERKRMTTVHRLPESYLCCTKGAPDEMLYACSHVFVNGEVVPMTEHWREQISKVNSEMAESALRVLGVAQRELPELPDKISVESIEKGMVFLGLIGMQDPPRPEAAAAVAECLAAGITPVMITGDHKDTAVAIARDVGIMTDDARALTGSELSLMTDEELEAAVDSVRVYARVAPEHKVRIVNAWRRLGKVVAMTGDGVNDAPALKAADIGAAMGITGTDVAKGAADMILTDDNFATIVSAVREGRTVFDNIRKSVFYLVSCNIGEIIVIFTAILLGLPRPLLPIQILWLNLITDGLPALALGVDPAASDLMKRKPRGRDQGVVDAEGAIRLVAYGVAVATLGLISFAVGLGWPGDMSFTPEQLDQARTMCLLTTSFAQLFHAFNFRSEFRSLLRTGIFANTRLVSAFLVSGGLQGAVTYVPLLARFFHLVPITGSKFAEAIGIAAVMLVVGEVTKLVRRSMLDRSGDC